MKFLSIFITLVIITFSISYGQDTTSGESSPVRFGINPVIGTKADVNDDLSMSEGLGIAVRTDISVRNRFSVVPEFIYYFPTPINANGFGGIDFTIWQLLANSHLYTDSKLFSIITPYFIGGLSYNYAEAEQRVQNMDVFENIDDVGAVFGIGLSGGQRFLAAEVKYDTAFDQMTFSAVFYFNAFD